MLRRRTLQRKAAEAQISNEEEQEMLRNLERKETELMRLQRHKVGIDDFELLTLIGKGAFGEVWTRHHQFRYWIVSCETVLCKWETMEL